jgi:hypothetical protein
MEQMPVAARLNIPILRGRLFITGSNSLEVVSIEMTADYKIYKFLFIVRQFVAQDIISESEAKSLCCRDYQNSAISIVACLLAIQNVKK